jgi:hypothetical protein
MDKSGRFIASNSATRLLASWSGTFETRVFQESTVLAAYAGTWDRQRNSQFMGSYAAVSTQADAIVDFTFTGSGVAWIGPKGPNPGPRARVPRSVWQVAERAVGRSAGFPHDKLMAEAVDR